MVMRNPFWERRVKREKRREMESFLRDAKNRIIVFEI